MPHLDSTERLELERKLHDPRWRVRLVRVQKIVEEEFERFRDQAEMLTIRAVVPRSTIKDLKSVARKIERRRQSGLQYGFADLEDLVGVKILCPYASDVHSVIDCMREHSGFKITPITDEEAKRETPEGYRGYHFTVQLDGPLLVNDEDLMGLKCEVQIKTMLEEAWDAKTHDVTYKRTNIAPNLQRQMRAVSDQLTVLDERTKVLKQLIMEEELEERRKKTGVAFIFLYESM